MTSQQTYENDLQILSATRGKWITAASIIVILLIVLITAMVLSYVPVVWGGLGCAVLGFSGFTALWIQASLGHKINAMIFDHNKKIELLIVPSPEKPAPIPRREPPPELLKPTVIPNSEGFVAGAVHRAIERSEEASAPAIAAHMEKVGDKLPSATDVDTTAIPPDAHVFTAPAQLMPEAKSKDEVAASVSSVLTTPAPVSKAASKQPKKKPTGKKRGPYKKRKKT